MKKFSLIISFVFFSHFCFPQDPFFTNTNQSLVYLNPSFSGSNGFIRNQTVYRNQWPNVSGPTYVTYGNAFDAYIKPLKGGVSLSVMNDDIGNGTLKMSFFNFAYAQYFSFLNNKLKVIPSVQFGYFVETLDKTKLNFGEIIHPRYNIVWNDQSSAVVPTVSKKNLNLSSGLLITYNGFTFGVGAFNANQPDIGLVGFHKLPVRTCINASYNLPICESSLLHFSSVSNIQMNTVHSQFITTLVYKKVFGGIGGGVWRIPYYYEFVNSYNYPVELVLTAGLHFKKFNISYAFDRYIPKYGFSTNSHQISLSLNFKSKKDSIQKIGIEYW